MAYLHQVSVCEQLRELLLGKSLVGFRELAKGDEFII
jgi:hypothetical protein